MNELGSESDSVNDKIYRLNMLKGIRSICYCCAELEVVIWPTEISKGAVERTLPVVESAENKAASPKLGTIS